MNILTDEEIVKACNATGSTALLNKIARAIEAAVLSKLAEQDVVEPAWYYKCWDIANDCDHIFYKAGKDAPPPESKPLYQYEQLLAAQQKAAEACATLIASVNANGSMRFTHRDEILEAMHNGEWREYL